MAKEIQYDVEARGALKNGVDKLANAVKVTFGPRSGKIASCIRAVIDSVVFGLNSKIFIILKPSLALHHFQDAGAGAPNQLL